MLDLHFLLRRRALLGLGILAFPLIFPAGAAAASADPLLLAVNEGEASLGIIEPGAGRQLTRIVEGDITGHEVAASADGRLAYVPIYGNSSVGDAGSDGQTMVVIDIASHQVVSRLDFGHGVRPHCVVLNPRDGQLYVTTELDHTITIVDPRTLKISGVIPTGQPESHMLALSHDGRRGYTSNVSAGTVSVLDIPARKLVAIIPVSLNTQRIAISADDRLVFTSDQTTPRLAVIDTASNTVKTWVSLPAPGYGTAATSDGHWLLVAMPKASAVAVVNLKTLQVERTILLPNSPHEILVAPGDRVAYVSCPKSGKVAAIDVPDWTVKQLIDAGSAVDGLAWAAPRSAAPGAAQ